MILVWSPRTIVSLYTYLSKIKVVYIILPATSVSDGHSPVVAPYFMNDRNVEFQGLLSVLSVPPLGIFDFFLALDLAPK
jgi:hypothetical protein